MLCVTCGVAAMCFVDRDIVYVRFEALHNLVLDERDREHGH